MFCFLIYIFGKKHNPVETAATFGVSKLTSNDQPPHLDLLKFPDLGQTLLNFIEILFVYFQTLGEMQVWRRFLKKPTDM